jgi:hypothetical protein
MPVFWCCCPTNPPVVAAGCPCSGGAAGTALETLAMHVVHPELNQQNFNACTLVYQPTPAAYAVLSLGAFNWFSNETFTDLGTLDHYRYIFRCESGYFIIRKIYVISIFGSPHLSTVMYRWLIGFDGNQCEGPPRTRHFQLLAGQIYTNGDPTTVVTIVPP